MAEKSDEAAIQRRAAEGSPAENKARIGTTFDLAVVITKQDWRGAFHVIYRDVLESGIAARVEVFNGSYGLNRELAASSMMLAPMVQYKSPFNAGWWTGALFVMAEIYAFRMFRFGFHFAREEFIRFLLLPDART